MTIDRKALKREYKETPCPMGVFQIRNKVSGKVFVGSSANLPAIFNRHKAQLRFVGHPVKELQKDWQELGEEAFEFEVLDTLTPPKDRPDYNPARDLTELEALWLEKLSPFDERGYNKRPKGAG